MIKSHAKIETGTPNKIEAPIVKYNFPSEVDPKTGTSVVVKAKSREEALEKLQSVKNKKPSQPKPLNTPLLKKS